MATQARAAATRQILISTGVDLFVEHGYLNVQPKDIASAAGLTTGAFYYHFKSKEELAAAIIDAGWPIAQKALIDQISAPTTGLAKVIAMTFAVIDTVNLDKTQWIGFHLNQAIGHLSPASRNEYFERVDSFFKLVAEIIEPSELRSDVTRTEAAELIWMAMNGAQLLSDAFGEPVSAVFDRLVMAWRATLHAITSAASVDRLQQTLTATAAEYPKDPQA